MKRGFGYVAGDQVQVSGFHLQDGSPQMHGCRRQDPGATDATFSIAATLKEEPDDSSGQSTLLSTSTSWPWLLLLMAPASGKGYRLHNKDCNSNNHMIETTYMAVFFTFHHAITFVLGFFRSRFPVYHRRRRRRTRRLQLHML